MEAKTLTEDKTMATEVAKRIRATGRFAEVHPDSTVSWMWAVRVTFANGRSCDIDLVEAFVSEGHRLGTEAGCVAELLPRKQAVL
jgi:hypothetical protein